MKSLDKKDPIDAFKKSQRPTALDENADDVDKEIFKESIKQYVSMEKNARRNLQKTYGLMWGQTSSALRSTLRGLDDFEVNSKN